MNSLAILISVILGIAISCVLPRIYNNFYIEKYGGDGISFVFAGMLGLSVLFLWCASDMGSGWHIAAIAAVVISALLNIFRIVREMAESTAPLGQKILFILCQLLFAIGVFGVAFLILFAIFSAGKKRKKR